MPRECSDCKENDRSYNFSLHYKCQNDWCENYVAPLCMEIKVSPCIEIKVSTCIETKICLRRRKIDEFFTVEYIVNKK